MRYALALTVIMLASCATTPVPRDIQRTFAMEGQTVDDLWPAVIETFGSRGWAIDNMERASGLITTDWMNVQSTEYMDCGSPGIGVHRDRRVRFNVFVRESEDGADLSVNTSWRATCVNCGGTFEVDCVSTGVLEQEVREEVATRVR